MIFTRIDNIRLSGSNILAFSPAVSFASTLVFGNLKRLPQRFRTAFRLLTLGISPSERPKGEVAIRTRIGLPAFISYVT